MLAITNKECVNEIFITQRSASSVLNMLVPMQLGLKNSPATFQRLMDEFLEGKMYDGEISRFLGTVGYYRRFIPNCVEIARRSSKATLKNRTEEPSGAMVECDRI